MDQNSISLWLAFQWAGPVVMAVLLLCLLIPLIVLFGARRWGWPQYVLKLLSIAPLALASVLVLDFLRLVHEVIFAELGIDMQNAALGALGEIRLLTYAGFVSVFLSLLASCIGPRPVLTKE